MPSKRTANIEYAVFADWGEGWQQWTESSKVLSLVQEWLEDMRENVLDNDPAANLNLDLSIAQRPVGQWERIDDDS